MKIFEWNKLTIEQKADLATGNSIFAICCCVALALFIFGMSFNFGILLIASLAVFIAGIFITRRFLKKAGGKKVFADVKKQLDEKIEKHAEEKEEKLLKKVNKELKEKEESKETPKKTSILGLDEEEPEEFIGDGKGAIPKSQFEKKPLVETETERVDKIDKIREEFED